MAVMPRGEGPCTQCGHDPHEDSGCQVWSIGRRCGCRWYIQPPKPEEVASSLIVTEWTCVHCHADLDVWGAAEGWMECHHCGEYSYLLHLV
jgi:hypothetical protein